MRHLNYYYWVELSTYTMWDQIQLAKTKKLIKQQGEKNAIQQKGRDHIDQQVQTSQHVVPPN